MSFADVIKEASIKKLEKDTHATKVIKARHQELIELAKEADRQIDGRGKHKQKDSTWPSKYAPIDYKPWYSYIEEQFSKGQTSIKIAQHIESIEKKPCTYQNVAAVMANITKRKRLKVG